MSERQERREWWLIIGLLSTGVGCGCLLLGSCVHVGQKAYLEARRIGRANMLGLGVASYSSQHGAFPAAYEVDDDGTHLHSWRARLLPFVEERDLYGCYDFGEPWNGPNNRRLAGEGPWAYRSPQYDSPHNDGPIVTTTNFLAVVGPETAWPGAVATKFDEFTDGFGQTLAIMELPESKVPWMEPRDLTYKQGTLRLPGDSGAELAIARRDGILCLFADGSSRKLSKNISPSVLRALITVRGEEQVDEADY